TERILRGTITLKPLRVAEALTAEEDPLLVHLIQHAFALFNGHAHPRARSASASPEARYDGVLRDERWTANRMRSGKRKRASVPKDRGSEESSPARACAQAWYRLPPDTLGYHPSEPRSSGQMRRSGESNPRALWGALIGWQPTARHQHKADSSTRSFTRT